MRGTDGLSAAHELARKVPTAKVLVITQYARREYVMEAVKEAGVAGYFLKTEDGANNIVHAIRAVHGGGQYFSPSIARMG
jgi:two-component system response regulator DesR